MNRQYCLHPSHGWKVVLRNVWKFLGAVVLAAMMIASLMCFAQTTAVPTKSTQGEYGPWLGRTVDHIEFTGAPNLSPEKLLAIVPLKVGGKLNRAILHASLQNLYSTGRYDQIEVEISAAHTEEGVGVQFRLSPAYFIGTVRVVGAPRPPTASQLENTSKLDLGQTFTQKQVDAAIINMQQLLHDHGYFKSLITVEKKLKELEQQIDFDFHVIAGPQARIAKVDIEGDPGITQEERNGLTKMKVGDRASLARQTRAVERLQKHYQKQQHLEAQAIIKKHVYDPTGNTVEYVFHVDRGVPVQIETEGASVSKGTLKKLVPVFEENAVDADLMNEGRRNLRDYFQKKGYFNAKVDFWETDTKDGEHIVTFDIDRGDLHKVESVTISGNKYFDRETIRERLQAVPATLLVPHGRFSQAILARDVAVMEQLYRSNGFQQVKVTGSVNDSDEDHHQNRLHITYIVEEGAQTKVAKDEFEGNAHFKDEELLDAITLTPGQPFSASSLASDRDGILNFYLNRGYPAVQVEAVSEKDPLLATAMNVRFKIVEGDRVTVDRVLISGLEHTRLKTVEKQLQITPGQPLSLGDMLETQRKLYDLGLFNEVKVAIQDPLGVSAEKNILIDFDEAPRTTFYYGIGFEFQTGAVPNNCTVTGCQPQGRSGVSPRVSFDVTRSNVFGRDQTVLFKSRLGRLQQRALVSFISPHLFDNPNLTLTLTSFYDKTQDVFTFTAERIEGSVQLEQRVNKATTLLYRMTYRRVSVDATTLQVDPSQIPLLSKPVRVAIPSFTWIRDTRDNPIDSKRGMLWTADFGLATTRLGSESDFGRVLIQNSTYYAFKKKLWVFARSTRIGLETPYGNTTDTTIPLPERFYAGGSNSLRGFSINQAGPRDLLTGFPIGGAAMFVNSFELRTPPLPFPLVEENLSAVIFHDAGNVFSSRNRLLGSLAKVHQDNAANCKDLSTNAPCDFDYMSHTVGVGLRYKTPIGPVRVDFSYNLNPTQYPIRTPAANASVQRLPHFNFFFSIGQTF